MDHPRRRQVCWTLQQWLLPTGCLFGAFQAASNERPWDNRHSALFVRLCASVCVTVAVNSVCAGEQCMHKTCVRAWYHTTSGCSDIARLTNPRSISRYRYQLSAASLLRYLISVVPKISVSVWQYHTELLLFIFQLKQSFSMYHVWLELSPSITHF